MEKIKARRMTLQEVATFEKGTSFLAPRHNRQPGILVPVRMIQTLSAAGRAALEAGMPDMQSMPSLSVQSEYGSLYSVRANEVWAADEGGEPMCRVETVGTQVSLVLYAPGMEGSDVLERVRKALRAEFGPGILQLRQETHQPVSEVGLPPVLGVPDGQLPRII